MKRKRILTLFLVFMMLMSLTLPAFAEEAAGIPETESAGNLNQPGEQEEESVTPIGEGGEEETLLPEEATTAEEVLNILNEDISEDEVESTVEAANMTLAEKEGWTTADFTYSTMEQTLNGCDYTRQFTIRGSVVSGFSESGLEKLKNNKDLVIPAANDAGELLVGVEDNAFAGQGLTSVTFPTGMMVDYDDDITHTVTRRGNFIIGMNAFAKNNLTSVYLPEGVIAVMSSAFRYNQLQTVTLPKTIWWIETLSFANNQISKVNFPKTTDFQMEAHGMAFADNDIKSVRIPDYTAVINKHVFALNPGMEACPQEAPANEQSLGGVVYMYTDNANLEYLDRIHHIGKTVDSQKSWHQKIVYQETVALEGEWGVNDFTYDGTVITGLSESGIAKRAVNKNLVLPDRNPGFQFITELASTTNNYGLFATQEEGFDTVELPNRLIKVGQRAFVSNGLTEITFPSTIKEIGIAAFQGNNLTSVILPDTVTTLGGGAFGSNPDIERISISKGLTEISAGAFGCSDAKNWMEKLTSIVIPEGIIVIGNNAFAGNNFSHIEIPSTVKSIGNYAFSTKNYLMTPCTLNLPEGLESIGTYAFRNKIIAEVELPSTVTGLKANTFQKEYSDSTEAVVTKVIVTNADQYYDKDKFPASEYHKIYLLADNTWTAEDFEYGEMETSFYLGNASTDTINITSWAVTGFSEQGEAKLAVNKHLVIPAVDSNGKQVTAVAKDAFNKKGLESVIFPEDVKTDYSGSWNENISERGNFIIGYGAFRYNSLTSLSLPEGVLKVDTYAFANNKLTVVGFPSTIAVIGQGSFFTNEIRTVDFPESCDFDLAIYNQAFFVNQLEAVELPDNTTVVLKMAFLQNTGKEEVASTATAAEKKGGVVYMYTKNSALLSAANISHLDNATNTSAVQKLIVGEAPAVDTPWGINDFTYDPAKTTITGLSESGQAKIQVNSSMVLPSQNQNGEDIIAIGDSDSTKMGVGTVGFKDSDGTVYTPTTIILPSKLKAIGTFAFSGNKFTSISLPKTLETIGQTAFQNSALISVVIPDSVTSMGMGTFSGSANLETVILSANVVDIPQASFTTTAVKNLVIPEGIKTIGRTAFSGTEMESVSLPSTLISIDNQAFFNHQLEALEIPENVVSIGQSAFSVQKLGLVPTLVSLILPEGLETIAQDAFRQSGLTELEIPSTLTTLHTNAFRESSNDNTGDYAGKVILYTSNKEGHIDNPPGSFAKSGAAHEVVYNVLANTGWNYEDFTIEGSVLKGWTEEGHKTRLEADHLVLPDVNEEGEPITSIVEGAFKIPGDEVETLKDGYYSPNGFKSVTFPKDLVSVGKQAFEFNNFTELEFPDTLEEIGECAFKGNKLKTLVLPDSVKTLGEGAFSVNQLTDITLSKGLSKIENAVFSMNISLIHIEIPNNITEIGEMAFAGARLTSLAIPESVTVIGRKAFHLHHLTELVIPGTVKEIGESAFEGTYKGLALSNLILEEGIEKIGKYAFKEGLLQEVTLPSTLVELGETPFYNNEGIAGSKTVVCNTAAPHHLLFTESETHTVNYTGTWTQEFFTYSGQQVTGFSEIGEVYITRNSDLIIPAALPSLGRSLGVVTQIDANAFAGYGITTVVLPENLVSVGAGAFARNRLTEVQLPETLIEIASDAFAGNGIVVRLLTNNQEIAEKYPEGSLIDAVIVYSAGNENNGENGSENSTENGDKTDNGTGKKAAAASTATGDSSTMVIYLISALAALAVIGITVKKKVNR